MPEKATTLEVLADKLRSLRPLHITALIEILGNYEYYAQFVEMVKEYLPDKYDVIFGEEEPGGQMGKFAKLFEDKYFPLWPMIADGELEEYSELTMNIPLVSRGFGYQEYENLTQDTGISPLQIMSYFLEQPWGDEGERVILGEAISEYISVEQLKRIPHKGFKTEELHKYLDGTRYAALATWGDMIHMNTGNEFLDCDDETASQSQMPEWNRENVEYFTEEWKKADQIDEPVTKMTKKFYEHPKEYFLEVMNFIDRQSGVIPETPTREEQIANGQLELAVDIEEEKDA